MAEAIARSVVDDSQVFVASAGVMASSGAHPSPEAIRTLEAMGIEHDGRSTPLSPDMIRKADLVLCMTRGHQQAARALVRDDEALCERIQLLDPDGDIPDPIGQGQAVYDSVAARMKQLIPDRLERFMNSAG